MWTDVAARLLEQELVVVQKQIRENDRLAWVDEQGAGCAQSVRQRMGDDGQADTASLQEGFFAPSCSATSHGAGKSEAGRVEEGRRGERYQPFEALQAQRRTVLFGCGADGGIDCRALWLGTLSRMPRAGSRRAGLSWKAWKYGASATVRSWLSAVARGCICRDINVSFFRCPRIRIVRRVQILAGRRVTILNCPSLRQVCRRRNRCRGVRVSGKGRQRGDSVRSAALGEKATKTSAPSPRRVLAVGSARTSSANTHFFLSAAGGEVEAPSVAVPPQCVRQAETVEPGARV
jgi:hypothetical protein